MRARNVIRLFSIGLIVMVFMTSCLEFLIAEDPIANFRVYNLTNDTVYYHIYSAANGRGLTTSKVFEYSLDTVRPKSSVSDDWDLAGLKHLGMNFILLEQSTIEKYSLDEIREQNIYDFGAVYHYSDLEKMQFTIEVISINT